MRRAIIIAALVLGLASLTGCQGTQERILARVSALEEQYQEAEAADDAAEAEAVEAAAAGEITAEDLERVLAAIEERRAERDRLHDQAVRRVAREEYRRAAAQGEAYAEGIGAIAGGASTGNVGLILGGLGSILAALGIARQRKVAHEEAAQAEARVHAARNESREIQGMVGHDKRSVQQAGPRISAAIVPVPPDTITGA